MFLQAQTHLGTKNLNFQFAKYVHKRRADGVFIINLHKTWEKILLAARAITAIENPKDVCAISGRTQGQRAVLKFGVHVGATAFAGRFTPGTFTNQIQKAFQEPRLLIVTDPREDHQPITEASYVNIPVVAFCDTDSPIKYVDIVIPCNNKHKHSIGLIWWMLARSVLRMRGSVKEWNVMVDLYFYREDTEKEEQAAAAPKEFQTEGWDAETGAPATTTDEWSAQQQALPSGDNWNQPGAEWGGSSWDQPQ